MRDEDRLPLALMALRLGVFLVMLVWTIDKFVNPGHSATVYEKFYFIGGLGSTGFSVIGVVEMALILAFVTGYQKRFSYGAVLLLHTISTLSSYQQYQAPYENVNIMFFAAWPMLAACFALYLLRDSDTMWTVGKG